MRRRPERADVTFFETLMKYLFDIDEEPSIESEQCFVQTDSFSCGYLTVFNLFSFIFYKSFFCGIQVFEVRKIISKSYCKRMILTSEDLKTCISELKVTTKFNACSGVHKKSIETSTAEPTILNSPILNNSLSINSSGLNCFYTLTQYQKGDIPQEETRKMELISYIELLAKEEKYCICKGPLDEFNLNFAEEKTFEVEVYLDVDSFFWQSYDLSIFNFELYLFVPYFNHDKCADIVCTSIETDRIRDYFSYTLGCFGEGKIFRTYIVFPYIQSKEFSARLISYLYEAIILQALKKSSVDTQRIPTSMNHSMEKFRNSFGSVNMKGYWIEGHIFEEFIKNVKEICDLINCEWNFRDPFFHTEAKGLKSLTTAATSQESINLFSSICSRSFKKLPENIVLDIAFEVRPVSKNHTLIFTRNFLEYVCDHFDNPSSITIDSYCQNWELGGLRGKPKNQFCKENGVYFLQAYSVDKDIMSGKSKMITDVINPASNNLSIARLQAFKSRINTLLSSSRNKKFGCRLEFRVDKIGLLQLQEVENDFCKLFKDVKPMKAISTNLLCRYKDIKSNSYLNLMLNTLIEKKLQRKWMKCSF